MSTEYVSEHDQVPELKKLHQIDDPMPTEAPVIWRFQAANLEPKKLSENVHRHGLLDFISLMNHNLQSQSISLILTL